MTDIRIRLHGGPADIPPQHRERSIAPQDLDDHVRIGFRAGYEHFQYAGVETHADGDAPVRQYEWAYHTAIAE